MVALIPYQSAKMAESDGRDWREFCAAAADECDAARLLSLVDQILQALDKADLPTTSPKTQGSC
jgi:hypothetical protein